MRINFILPYNTWSGAFRSTYELSNHLIDRGESVEVYIPFVPYLDGSSIFSLDGIRLLSRGLARSLIRRNLVPWFDLKAPVRMVPTIHDRYLRDADVVIANHWPTAFSVAKLSPAKGRKYHFVRDTEPWKGQKKQVSDSYQLPLRKIVVSPWLKEYLARTAGVEVLGIVPNGINMKAFGVRHKRNNDPPIIGMMYYDDPRKGMSDGITALNAIKMKYPQVRIVLFGWKKPSQLPQGAEFHWRPVKEELKEIYARSDIFLWTSRQEGFGNPPREAMAAKCAVVATNVGCIPTCTIPGKTALVVEPGDIEGIERALTWFLDHPQEMKEFGERASDYIQQFTWERAASQLLKLVSSHESNS